MTLVTSQAARVLKGRLLKCERDTPEMGERVAAAFKAFDDEEHRDVHPVFEHGQWWINCNPCGAQWSVNDAEGPGAVDGFGFEQVSQGDGYCAERNQ